MGDDHRYIARLDLFGLFFWCFINIDQHVRGAKCYQFFDIECLGPSDHRDRANLTFRFNAKIRTANNCILQFQCK